ncbi:phage baseplate assembly protein V [Fodinicurvata sp. EGI_FJ10296]|uniref:phage baseplate assembly protein V n=1 Tax=Fodinicurvata sp. EGI_FJ10296 TaxID=3231908 RepID=UPI00345706C8
MPERRHLTRDLSDVERQVNGVIRYARVTEINHAAARVRVTDGPIVSNWIRWAEVRAGADRTWDPPTVGERVIVVCPGGDLNNGTVIARLNCTDNPPPDDRPAVDKRVYADGTVVEHDGQAGTTRLTTPGRVIIEAEGDIALRSKGAIEIRAEGAITINGATVDIN